ncbi:MAG: aminoacyl-tRNA hydrolase [Bacteroidales bacterium]|nr:aminoacyl-tRNA hydrolase [Bacteroidales bacterium]
MKYLIVGLGNVGSEYSNTRHNSGFMAADALVRKVDEGAKFTLERHAYRAEVRYKGRTLVVIKPTTLMNLSGKAVRYWMAAEKVELANVLVFVDDIALPLGTLRMKRQGSHGGHNGLADIEAAIGSAAYCRLRIGVGNDFPRGRQIEYVLGEFSAAELAVLEPRLDAAANAALAFCTVGPERAMNVCNTQAKLQ